MRHMTRIIPTAGLVIAAFASFMLSPVAAAQSPQRILDMLDADSSGAISKEEAVDDMKANFSLIDTNGDGDIDLGELDRILKLVASQNRQSAPTAGNPADEIRPGVLRTPDERFENLPGYDFEPHYIEIGDYRVHYLDEGPRDGEIVLMLHGEPTWSYLYRKMVPVLTKAGYRCIVPDLIGFGRSDKPVSMDTHTYKFHVDTQATLVKELGLNDVTFFGQDWGGLIGLRVVAENESRFARVVIGNTGLRIGVEGIGSSAAFMRWKKMNQGMIDRGDIPTGSMVSGNVGDPSIKAAYDAPFPDPSYKAGALIMPQRVPVTPDDPSRAAQEAAWDVFHEWEKPFLTAFSDGDPITRGGETKFQDEIPGAKGQKHTTIKGAGHFLQEAKGPELAEVIVQFIKDNPLQILKVAASQNGESAPGQGPQRSPGGPSFGTRNPDSARFMNVPPEDDNMFYMLNVNKYREKAKYDDGRKTELSGREAGQLYNPMPDIAKAGGALVYAGTVVEQLVGKDPTMDTVALVMYPSRRKLMEMSSSSEWRDTAQHKSASLEKALIMVTTPEPWTFSNQTSLAAKDIPYPATAGDQSFTFFHLVKYRDVAEYPAGSNEPKRSGREAMELFERSVEDILHAAGVTPMLRAEVEGVVVGDGRTWSDYRMLQFPSHRAFEDVVQKIGASDFGHHHAAAIEDEYTFELSNRTDLTANPPVPGNVAQAGPQRSFDASQAPFILSSLDADNDGKISESEAPGQIKQNFSLVDANGDGGIDIDELTRILKMQSSQ